MLNWLMRFVSLFSTPNVAEVILQSETLQKGGEVAKGKLYGQCCLVNKEQMWVYGPDG